MSDRKCKLCGSELIEKDGRRGRFLSCVNWPKCKYSESIDQRIDDATDVTAAADPSL